MPEITTRTIAVNGVELFVHEAGDPDAPPVVLCHGFPELGYSWRHQLPALAEAGYHVLAPDQRGYGRSTTPEAVTDYDILHLTDDVLGLIDATGHEKAAIIGHDWGSMVVWQLALRAPERVAGVVGMSVPFMPRGPMPPIQMMRQLLGDDVFFYILYFQEPGVADAELGADASRTMRRMLTGVKVDEGATFDPATAFANDGRGFVDRMPEPDGLPDWLSQEELDHYCAEFTRTGFTGGINWYRNFDRNWELMADAPTKVEVPARFVGGKQDPVLMMSPPSAQDGWLLDDRGTVLVDDAGHWVQQEKPAETNAALLDFLGGLSPRW